MISASEQTPTLVFSLPPSASCSTVHKYFRSPHKEKPRLISESGLLHFLQYLTSDTEATP
jgi:hypothetical protein